MTAPRSRFAGLVAATLVAAAGLVGLAGAPASAALCSGTGVNVVVDHHGLGGGVEKSCDANGAGRTADKVFPAAGFALTYAQRQPGFVCRVNGAPSNDPCVNTSPADAYWGLYWSDGTSGKWTYATSGVGGLKVPSGGFVALSWQNGGASDPPGVAPVGARPTTKPTPKPAPKPAPKPTKKAGPTLAAKPSSHASASTPGAAASASAKASASAAPRASSAGKASPTPTASSSAAAAPTSSTTDSPSPQAEVTAQTQLTSTRPDSGGLPLWVPGAVVVVLGAVTGAVLWRRRVAGGRSGT